MRSELYIDGQWRKPTKNGTFAVVNPSTEEVIHHVPAATAEDIDAAVRAARKAFDEGPWPRMSGAERAGYLRRMGAKIQERLEELARLEVLDNGKPLPEARWDIGDTAGCFEFYASLAEGLDQKGEQDIALSDPRFSSRVVKEPVGVVGAIIPWNFPKLMAAWKVCPALAAGCTVVLKPSELTPLSAMELAAVADEVGLPPGVLNVVTGLGPDAGAPLAEHPGLDKIAFTGSVLTGSKIMVAAAAGIKNVSLELGGKSPFLVFEDSDIDTAVEWIMFGIFWNKGEVCSATSRVLIHEAIYDRVLARLVEESRRIKIGDGMEEGVLMGPLVSKGQYDKVLAAIERGKEEGARLLTGGGRPPGRDTGFFLEPTIFADVPQNSWIWREEIFGPVLCVHPFKTEEEAVKEANNSLFGLAAAVMSRDKARCDRVARALRAGIVWVNCSQPTFSEAPWGGFKQSGIGRELGELGLQAYLEAKQITSYDSEEPWGWYLK